MEATIFCDFASTRSTDPSLQIGTQTLPNAIAKPEHGVFATVITAPTLLVLRIQPRNIVLRVIGNPNAVADGHPVRRSRDGKLRDRVQLRHRMLDGFQVGPGMSPSRSGCRE